MFLLSLYWWLFLGCSRFLVGLLALVLILNFALLFVGIVCEFVLACYMLLLCLVLVWCCFLHCLDACFDGVVLFRFAGALDCWWRVVSVWIV